MREKGTVKWFEVKHKGYEIHPAVYGRGCVRTFFGDPGTDTELE